MVEGKVQQIVELPEAFQTIQSGQLPAQKIGGKWQIKADDFKDYLAGKFSRN